jgi:hypothetical protein
MSTLLSLISSGALGSQQPGGGELAAGFPAAAPGEPAVSNAPRMSPADEAYERDCRMEDYEGHVWLEGPGDRTAGVL